MKKRTHGSGGNHEAYNKDQGGVQILIVERRNFLIGPLYKGQMACFTEFYFTRIPSAKISSIEVLFRKGNCPKLIFDK